MAAIASTPKKEVKGASKEKEKTVVVSRGSSSSVKRTLYMNATAYTSYCDTGCIGVTATGVNVKNKITHNGNRIIAVDPSVIPLHSLVKVYPNNGAPFYAVAEDTGGAIKGNKIDILISTNDTNKAFSFGRQNVKVEILRSGK